MAAASAGAPAPALDKQSLCLDILVSGHVQAYVDFFYLTHRPEVDHEEEEAAEPEPQDEQVGIPSNMLPHVKTQLEEAEVARRRGDTQAVFTAYRQLADFFTGLEDQRTAIYFWEKCLEITQLTSDVEGEKQATRSLGMAHEASKDMAAAIKQYETLLDLTNGTSDVGGAQQANEHLVVAYEATAASRDAAGDAHGALECREKCLEAARASGDPAKERKAHYDLGQVRAAHEPEAASRTWPPDAHVLTGSGGPCRRPPPPPRPAPRAFSDLSLLRLALALPFGPPSPPLWPPPAVALHPSLVLALSPPLLAPLPMSVAGPREDGRPRPPQEGGDALRG